ncbi:maleate cis-trans isomerase [Nocardioides luteus]|uniref:Maleate cis-trans isomerase n=1 Tax=Nocardioides luteus TaxID=1844 RepID=A0ABQ5T3K2_9ACTN|nr:maleate cis-trans isomerase [Nocardioides luteus]MDR7310210.1 maleate cis-trans isomerase [Nocardioides luteus]GGR69580.1 maleate cis-trans isomerase [Nocardioides luteus]GLJ70322.1 maleate cis-trans isomerase [Nocardioides luteus]
MTRPPVVGLLYPGYAAEDDFPALENVLSGTIWLPLVHTSVERDEHTVEALLDTGSPARLAEGADAIAVHSPDSVVWACTSGSFVFGPDGAVDQVAAISERVGVPASSTSIAFLSAARALGLEKVAVAASYPEDLAEHFRYFLAAGGLKVVSFGAKGIFTAVDVGRLGPEAVIEMALAVDVPEAEAVLIPDTAMHTLTCIDALEEALGKPVLTANQVTIWEGLRLAGASGPLPGLGTLFR